MGFHSHLMGPLYTNAAPPRIEFSLTINLADGSMPKLFLAITTILLMLGVACSTDPIITPKLTPTATAPPVDFGNEISPSGTNFNFPDVAGVVERVAPAVVQVIATVPEQNFFGQTTDSRSQGSGVFFRKDGYILSNHHVVADATSVEIALSSRERVSAEIVGTDPATDLAVLKVDPEAVSGITVAKLGDTDTMRIGDWVIAIGSPLGFEGSVTVGIVSAKGRSLQIDQNSERLNDLVQTDAVINPGNSGGPLLNLAGEIIGINTAIIRGSIGNNQEAEGIGFSVSMGTAIPVSTQLIANGRVIRPRMGVAILDVTPVNAVEQNLSVDEGILIVALAPDGPAERAGLEVNDVITQIDSLPVGSTTELVRLFLTDYRVDDTVKVTVVRSAVTLNFDITLKEVN